MVSFRRSAPAKTLGTRQVHPHQIDNVLKPKPQLALSILLAIVSLSSAVPSPATELKTVALDPGHGGDDPGVISAAGTSEASVALDICRRLSRLFDARLGTTRVVLTRSSDFLLSTANRSALANGSKADLLLSIHAASSRAAGEKGTRVYFFNDGCAVVKLAERRLRPRLRQGLSTDRADQVIRLTPWATAGRFSASSSRLLASAIARSLPDSHEARGVPAAVLAGATMPSVLVEVGNLSNPEDDEKLRSGRYRQMLAGAIFRGIMSYAAPKETQEPQP